MADGRLSRKRISSEVEYCPNALPSHGRYSTYRTVFGSNPADMYSGQDGGDDPPLAHDVSISGQFARLWKPRAMAQEAALEEIASSRSRILLSRNQSFDCADVELRESVIFFEAASRQSAPRRQGPAVTPRKNFQGGSFLRASAG